MKKFVLFFAVCSLTIVTAFGQVPNPTFVSVGVNNDKKYPELHWTPVAGADGYIIYRFIEGFLLRQEIHRMPNPTASYFIDNIKYEHSSLAEGVYADPYSRSERYMVAAYNSVGLSAPIETHGTVYLHTTDFDPCEQTIAIEWDEYEGWAATHYEVYYMQSDDGLHVMKARVTKGTSYLLTDVKPNLSYTIWIIAHSGSKNANSNTKLGYTDIQVAPYINADFASVNENDELVLQFSFDESYPLDNFEIIVSEEVTGPYNFFADVAYGSSPITYTYPLNTVTAAYYKITATNECGELMTSSNPATVIHANVASGYPSIYYNNILWNAYELWWGGMDKYTVNRSANGGNWEEIGTVLTDKQLTYADNVEALVMANKGGYNEFCYYIEVTEAEANLYGVQGIARSNITCVTHAPATHFANAFNPKSHVPQNQIFRPVVTYNTESYKMMVYNRYGEIVYTSESPFEGWDGKIGGSDAPKDTYVYHIVYLNDDSLKEILTGSVTLIY